MRGIMLLRFLLVLFYANIAHGTFTPFPPSTPTAPLSGKGYLLSNDGVNNVELAAGTNNYVLVRDDTQVSGLNWIEFPVSLPDQTGNENKFLTTNGTDASWSDSISGAVLQANEFARVLIPNSANAGCDWFDRSTTGFQTPQSDADCGDAAVGGEVIGSITMADTKVPTFTLNNVVAGNTYSVDVYNLIYKTSTSQNVACAARMRVNGSTVYPMNSAFQGTNGIAVANYGMSSIFSFTAPSSGDISLEFQISENILNTCQIDTRLTPWRMSVKEYPAKADTVAMQNYKPVRVSVTDNDNQTILAGSTNIPFKTETVDNYNAWNSDTFTAPKKARYNFKGLVASQSSTTNIVSAYIKPLGAPTFAQVRRSAHSITDPDTRFPIDITLELEEGDQVAFRVSSNFFNVGSSTLQHWLEITEVIDNPVISGTFENINSTDLIKIAYGRPTTQSIPNNLFTTVIFNELQQDNSGGAYNPSTGVFTAPRSSNYKVCVKNLLASVLWTLDKLYEIRVNGTFGIANLDRVETEAAINKFQGGNGCREIEAAAGETVYIELYQNSGTAVNTHPSAQYNWITISEQPDYEAIVKNLYDSTTKCQTKVLSADITNDADGNLAELNFTNLNPLKKYRIKQNIKTVNSTSSAWNFGYSICNNGQRIGDTPANSVIENQYKECDFTGQSSITFATTNAHTTRYIQGNGSTFNTFVRLCELPDSYVETTEW